MRWERELERNTCIIRFSKAKEKGNKMKRRIYVSLAEKYNKKI